MNLFRASLLVLATIIAGAAAQSAMADEDSVMVVTPSNMQSVLAPGASSPYTYIFVEVCPTSRLECKDEEEKYELSPSLVDGGWLGPNVSHKVGFYEMEPTPDNMKTLSALCAESKMPGERVCDASKGQYPLLIMFRVDGTKSDTVIGPVDDVNFGYIIRYFAK